MRSNHDSVVLESLYNFARFVKNTAGNITGFRIPGTTLDISIGGINMSLAGEYATNGTFTLAVPATKAGGLMWVDGSGAGGGGGAGVGTDNWGGGGGGGSSGLACMMLPVRIPPSTTSLTITVGVGGAAGVGSTALLTQGTAGGAGGFSRIEDLALPAGLRTLLTLNAGSGGAPAPIGGAGVLASGFGGAGGAVGAPTYATGAGLGGTTANVAPTKGFAPWNVSLLTQRVLDCLYIQCGGAGGGGTDSSTLAFAGADSISPIAGFLDSVGGAKGGTSNQKAGGGAGGTSIFVGTWPGRAGSGGVGGTGTPNFSPTIPGCGGGGGGSTVTGTAGNGALGANGMIRIYW